MDDFDFENRIVSTDATSEDNENEVSLRPFDMDEYIGQEKAKEILKIYIDAVKLRGDYLDHVLLYGPPGLGKTTLSEKAKGAAPCAAPLFLYSYSPNGSGTKYSNGFLSRSNSALK